MDKKGIQIVPVGLIEMYKIIVDMGLYVLQKEEAMVCRKYRTVEKKVKASARTLPANSKQKRKEVTEDSTLRKSVDIRHTFTVET